MSQVINISGIRW